METTRLGGLGLAAAVLTPVVAFFFDFPAPGLGAAECLGSGFSGLAVILVAVNIGCSGTSVTGFGERFGLGGGVVVALTSGPIRRNPRPAPSARQRVWPAELSERQGGLWRRSFGHSRESALQEPPSHLSTLQIHGSSPFGFHRSHSTEAVPASTGEVEAPTRDAPGCVSAITLYMSKPLAALAMQWILRSHVRLNRHSQVAELGE